MTGFDSDYAEIGITTNFSFLHGGSHPQEYVQQASELHLPAIGIADHNTLAGVVRAYKELGNPVVKHKPKLLIGSRIVFIDGTPDILVYPRDREAYGRLCQLLTLGKRGDETEKGECLLKLDDLLEFAQGQLLVLALPHRFEACCTEATTGAGWRGCSASPAMPMCRFSQPMRCCTIIPRAVRCRMC
jgi:error-prone DNA polymerase